MTGNLSRGLSTPWRFRPLLIVVAGLCFMFLAPAKVHASEPCGQPALVATGSYFSSYELIEHTPEGFPILHLQNRQAFPDPTSFTLYWSIQTDDCQLADVNTYSLPVTLPANISSWSIRFTSATHFDIWDDEHAVLLSSRDIGVYPHSYRIAFFGTTSGGISTFSSQQLMLVQGTVVPILTSGVSKSDLCPGPAVLPGYYFDDSYEHAEYVSGLLRLHLRLKVPYNDGREFSSRALTRDETCQHLTSSSNLNIRATHFTPYTRYYSFRMTTPTHFELWDDENDVKFECPDCQGDIPADTPFVQWFGYLDGGSSYYISTPFAPTQTIGCQTNCFSNVLFLPGIESSRLYKPEGSGENLLWEPQSNADVQALYLNPDGSSVRDDVYTKVGEVIDEVEVPVLGSNVYKSFIKRMDDLKAAGTIADWEAIPYDWRLSLQDVLEYGHAMDGRIYYSGSQRATSTPYILQELRRLAASSKSGKVTIIAHSNGGLVVKALTQALGVEASDLIDKIVFIAVPQTGTPVAIAAGLHGYDQSLVFGAVLSKSTARTFGQNAPMTYNLLPSLSYFSSVSDPVVTFDTTLPTWIQKYGAAITSAFGLHVFLTDSYGRSDPQTGDTNVPIQMNNALLSTAEGTHVQLDTWAPPTGVSLIQIAGWGVPKTISGVAYKKKGNSITYEAKTTIDGDGTVVVPSALAVSTSTPGVSDYWVDLHSYNKLANRIAALRLKTSHADILEIPTLIAFISDIVIGSVNPITSYEYLSPQPLLSQNARLHFTLHSPLTLDLYDEFGRHTGISTTTGQVEEQIPGTYYAEFGETKQIFSDASAHTHLSMSGYAEGTFTLELEELSGNMSVASTTFQDIPTTVHTAIGLDVSPDLSELGPMHIDKDGDGTVDASLTPKLNGVVTFDLVPPEIEISFSTSTRALFFRATDDRGHATLSATTSYPIRKKSEKEYHGTATTTLIALDDAGNQTQLIYTEHLPSPINRDSITPIAIVYNGATTTFLGAGIFYKWRVDETDTYKLFATRMFNGDTVFESHYRPKKNVTIIMTKPIDLDDTESDDGVDARPSKTLAPGMVVPYVVTSDGKIIPKY